MRSRTRLRETPAVPRHRPPGATDGGDAGGDRGHDTDFARSKRERKGLAQLAHAIDGLAQDIAQVVRIALHAGALVAGVAQAQGGRYWAPAVRRPPLPARASVEPAAARHRLQQSRPRSSRSSVRHRPVRCRRPVRAMPRIAPALARPAHHARRLRPRCAPVHSGRRHCAPVSHRDRP